MNDLISLIVPVYNVELYLEQCLSSITKQSYRNIEIIIVNDGSTDNSIEIAKKFRILDHRIVIYSKQNGGLASARNYGFSKSNGDYVIFIDSDDYISHRHVENLYKTLMTHNADIAVSKMQLVDTKGKAVRLSCKDSGNIIELSRIDALKSLFLQKKFDNSASAKIYKRRFCEEYQFPEGKLYEDFAIIYKMFMVAEKVVYIDKSDYFYVQRPLSITNSDFNKGKLDLLQFIKEMISNKKLNELNLSKYGEVKSFSALVNLWRSIPYENEYNNVIWNELIKYRKSVLDISDSKIKLKMGACLSFLGRKISYLVLGRK
ncbi:glycosyltransferase family 2 protein [Enterococcus hulanensis]|uniref:glycosyltransferase family 2 protein n=1 Tax=Enterococcus hulanensis TaxID=2559929 RepID=UPI00288DF471|nr:glycosyltransferase family 2 protein [Enterococcus hulanensis]MDT2660059.1 glycosyltransferase family 2 protein [Enterococcus hulanensis]